MNNTQQQQSHPGQPNQPKDASGNEHQITHFTAQATRKETDTLNTPLHKDTDARNASLSSGQSVQANNVISSPLNDMFKVAAIAQQIMTELNAAFTEEQKLLAITRIVCSQMKENGH
jgi:hypothetical protein